MNLNVVKDSFCQISTLISDHAHLSDAEESLLFDLTMVVYYILEIKLTKRKNIMNGFIHFQ